MLLFSIPDYLLRPGRPELVRYICQQQFGPRGSVFDIRSDTKRRDCYPSVSSVQYSYSTPATEEHSRAASGFVHRAKYSDQTVLDLLGSSETGLGNFSIGKLQLHIYFFNVTFNMYTSVSSLPFLYGYTAIVFYLYCFGLCNYYTILTFVVAFVKNQMFARVRWRKIFLVTLSTCLYNTSHKSINLLPCLCYVTFILPFLNKCNKTHVLFCLFLLTNLKKSSYINCVLR